MWRRTPVAERLFRPDPFPGLRNTIPLLIPQEMRCIAWVAGRAGLHEAVSQPLGMSPGHSIGHCHHHPVGRSVQETELFTHTTTNSTSHPGGKPPAAADRPGCAVTFPAKPRVPGRCQHKQLLVLLCRPSWRAAPTPGGMAEQLQCFVLLLPPKRRHLPFGESSGLEQPGRSMPQGLPHDPPPLLPPRHRLAKPCSHNSQAFFQVHGQGLAWAGAPSGRSCSRRIPERSPGLAPSKLLPSKLHFSYKWSTFGPIL